MSRIPNHFIAAGLTHPTRIYPCLICEPRRSFLNKKEREEHHEEAHNIYTVDSFLARFKRPTKEELDQVNKKVEEIMARQKPLEESSIDDSGKLHWDEGERDG